MISTQFEYYAFISYKHEDEKWAEWLQNKLETYKIPSSLPVDEKRDFPKSLRPCFRDKTDTSKTGDLKKILHDELQKSQYLIVICSPRSAKSNWVNEEVKTFQSIGRADKIIPFIIEGNPDTSNPDAHCYPTALDENILGISIPELGKKQAVVKAIAVMLNIKFDTLWNRYRERILKRRIQIAIFTAIFIAAFGGFSMWQTFKISSQRIAAETNLVQANLNLAEAKIKEAEKLMAEYDYLNAQVLLAEALILNPYHEPNNYQGYKPKELKFKSKELISRNFKNFYTCIMSKMYVHQQSQIIDSADYRNKRFFSIANISKDSLAIFMSYDAITEYPTDSLCITSLASINRKVNLYIYSNHNNLIEKHKIINCKNEIFQIGKIYNNPYTNKKTVIIDWEIFDFESGNKICELIKPKDMFLHNYTFLSDIGMMVAINYDSNNILYWNLNNIERDVFLSGQMLPKIITVKDEKKLLLIAEDVTESKNALFFGENSMWEIDLFNDKIMPPKSLPDIKPHEFDHLLTLGRDMQVISHHDGVYFLGEKVISLPTQYDHITSMIPNDLAPRLLGISTNTKNLFVASLAEDSVMQSIKGQQQMIFFATQVATLDDDTIRIYEQMPAWFINLTLNFVYNYSFREGLMGPLYFRNLYALRYLTRNMDKLEETELFKLYIEEIHGLNKFRCETKVFSSDGSVALLGGSDVFHSVFDYHETQDSILYAIYAFDIDGEIFFKDSLKILPLENPENPSLFISANNKKIGFVYGNKLNIWNLDNNDLTISKFPYTGNIREIQFSPDGNFIGMLRDITSLGECDGNFELFDLQSQSTKIIHDIGSCAGNYAFSPDEKNIVVYDEYSSAIFLYNIQSNTANKVTSLVKSDSSIIDQITNVKLLFLSDNLLLCSYDQNRNLIMRVYDVKNSNLVCEKFIYKNYEHYFYYVDYRKDGLLLFGLQNEYRAFRFTPDAFTASPKEILEATKKEAGIK